MAAQILDGLVASKLVKNSLKSRISRLQSTGITPGLGTLLVGEDPASKSYVLGKHRDCAEVGIESIRVELPSTAGQEEVLNAVRELNMNPSVSGFIVQLPLPSHLDENAVLEAMSPDKDADGLHPTNLGKLVLVKSVDAVGFTPVPCTPAGILRLLENSAISVSGKHVVVLGRGVTVGRPFSILAATKGVDATVTTVHSKTPNIAEHIKAADVVIAALGQPHFVQKDWIKPGAVVVDVGVTRVGTSTTGRAILNGDVHPDVFEVASWVSPNPGGVGPMTRAMLLENVVGLAESEASKGRN